MTSLTQLVGSTPALRTFSSYLRGARLDTVLNGPGIYTLLAPIGSAFQRLPENLLAQLRQPGNALLGSVLRYHILPGRVTANDIMARVGSSLQTLDGQAIRVITENGQTYLVDSQGRKARLLTVDADADNGLLHTVDAVLIPADIADRPLGEAALTRQQNNWSWIWWVLLIGALLFFVYWWSCKRHKVPVNGYAEPVTAARATRYIPARSPV